jgi:hypothetical protein
VTCPLFWHVPCFGILPVKNRGQLRLRLVARPDKPVAQLLAHLGLALPTSPKIIQNVVEKIA